MDKSNQSPFQKLLYTEMTRKEFLAYVGLLLLSLTGVAGFMKAIKDPTFLRSYPKQTKGFGSSSYGGKENS